MMSVKYRKYRTIKNTENTETPKHAIQTANPGMVKVELKT